MGAGVPVLSPQEVIRRLKLLGFFELRQKGSHIRFGHADGRKTTVPMHKGYDIDPRLLRLICKEISLTVEEFLAGT